MKTEVTLLAALVTLFVVIMWPDIVLMWVKLSMSRTIRRKHELELDWAEQVLARDTEIRARAYVAGSEFVNALCEYVENEAGPEQRELRALRDRAIVLHVAVTQFTERSGYAVPTFEELGFLPPERP